MLRIFSLGIALLATSLSANAALLVSYNFSSTNGSVYNPTSKDSGVDASAFNPNSGGSVASGIYTAGGTLSGTTGSQNKGDFSLSPLDHNSLLQIDRIVLDFGPSAQLNSSRNMVVTLNLPDGSALTATSANGAGTGLVAFDNLDLGLLLTADQSAFSFTAKLNGTQSTPAVMLRLDNIQIYGSVVPEPTSIAIFSSIGMIAVVRRIRKKNS
jgi:hypothetical protein